MYQALKDGRSRENNAVVFHRLTRWVNPLNKSRNEYFVGYFTVRGGLLDLYNHECLPPKWAELCN